MHNSLKFCNFAYKRFNSFIVLFLYSPQYRLIFEYLLMAIPIKSVPILSGEIADDFVRKAEEREKNPGPGLSPEREERIAKVMKQMREFKFPWEK